MKGDTFEVMGTWKVAVHDNTRLYQPWEKPYFVLSAGDVYNMKTRKIEKYGTGARGRGGDWRTGPGGSDETNRRTGDQEFLLIFENRFLLIS